MCNGFFSKSERCKVNCWRALQRC